MVLVQPGRVPKKALRALEAATAEAASQRAAAVDRWLGHWVTAEARKRCFGTLRAADFRAAHAGLVRPQVSGRT